MIGLFRATAHVQMPFCFRSEFGPLDSSQSIFSPSFHPSHIRTEETLLLLIGCSWFWPALWLCCLVVFGFALGVCFGLCSFSPSTSYVSFSSTMTWALCPHGVRTRGKKKDLESVDTPSSDNSDNRAWHLAQAVAQAPTGRDNAVHLSKPTLSPQLLSPPLFVSWNQVASLRGLVAVHKDIKSCPHDELHTALDHPKCMFPGEKKLFLAANGTVLDQLENQIMPLERIAAEVFQAMYQRQQAEFSWHTLLWTVAQQNEYWIGGDALPLPPVLQIHCGGLGGGALESDIPPHFHCTCPPVGDSQVYGPSLSPAAVVQDEHFAVAAGSTTGGP